MNGEAAEQVLLAAFDIRPDLLRKITFDGQLTCSRRFCDILKLMSFSCRCLLGCFIAGIHLHVANHDHLLQDQTREPLLLRIARSNGADVKSQDESGVEDCLPVATLLAFRLEHAFTALLQEIAAADGISTATDDLDDENLVAAELKIAEKQFIVKEIVLIAMKEDYGDEVGRGKMFGLMRRCFPSAGLHTMG